MIVRFPYNLPTPASQKRASTPTIAKAALVGDPGVAGTPVTCGLSHSAPPALLIGRSSCSAATNAALVSVSVHFAGAFPVAPGTSKTAKPASPGSM
jgi:hypothetical protein